MLRLTLPILGLFFCSYFAGTFAYIPAIPTNTVPSTSNGSNRSTIQLTWATAGSFSTEINYQRPGVDSVGISKVTALPAHR